MFERNIEETIAFIRKGTIEGADSITSRQIFASPMQPALKRLFEADIEIWMRDEKERLLKSPHFRYDDPEVQQLFDRIGESTRDYALFTAEEYNAALEKNVILLFNYVCRPQWTLVKYLFAEREHAATDNILEALRSFWHYEYYQIILREYFDKKNLSVINMKKFTELIERIDAEVVRSFDSRRIAHLSEPLFELFNMGDQSNERMAPIEALSIFYDDKNLGSIVERLDQEKRTHEMMTLHDLVMLISEADFSLGVDISTIVSEQFNQKGSMRPERNVTAGEDFDLPQVSGIGEEESHHGEYGSEHDALNFVISDEEEGAIVLEDDHITSTTDEVDEVGLSVTDEPPEDGAKEEAFGFLAPEDSHAASGIAEAVDDDEVSSYTDESILKFGAIADDSDDVTTEDVSMPDDEVLMDESIPDIFIGDDDVQPGEHFLGSKDEIPDITLEELGSIRFDGDEDEAVAASSEESTFDSYLTNASINGPADLSVIGDATGTKILVDEDIDWEKEAEGMEDIDLENLDPSETRISESLPHTDDPFRQDDQLKPAEELLGQLDLDDFETAPVATPTRQNDIPIVEDETPLPQSYRLSPQDKDDEEIEDVVSAEEVIREFGDLNQLLPAGDRKKYAKKLFGKNEEALNRAIQILNGKSTWRQASEYIDELFIKFDVDMYSRLAVKFTDDIYKRYTSKK
jgi:hypothetical protein